MNLILALVSAAAYGVSDFVGGLAARRHPALQVVLWAFPVSAVVLLLLSWLIGGDWDTRAIAWRFARASCSSVWAS